MQTVNKEICTAFSNGKFNIAYNFFAEDIEWNIVGDKILSGKNNVVDFCNNTAAYFTTVTTKFLLGNLIVDNNCVVIDGTAQFITNENNIINISSCDVYLFNDGLLKKITSYCIVTDKK